MLNRILAILFTIILLSGCGALGKGEAEFPKDPDIARRLRYGKITGDGGLKLFGEDDDSGAANSGLAVNSFLWRATLETLSFVPLASADPFGGVILTDWYENPEARGERFKINTLILDKKLRVDALKVTVYKQKLDKAGWRDVAVDENIARDLEDKILMRAREMRVAQTVKK